MAFGNSRTGFITYSCIKCVTEKLHVDYHSKVFSFVQCGVSLMICLTTPEYLTFYCLTTSGL